MKVSVFLCYFLQHDEVRQFTPFRQLLPLVFMDPVNGYSKPKLFVKEQVSFKNKSRFGYVCPL